MEHEHPVLGVAAQVVTAATLGAAWFAEIEMALRLALTVVGIVSGVYAALYWRHKLKRLEKDDSADQ